MHHTDRSPSRPWPSPAWRLAGPALVCLSAGMAEGCRSLPLSARGLPDQAAALAPGSLSAANPKDRDRLAAPVRDAVARLLARHLDDGARLPVPTAVPGAEPPATRRLCFVGVVAATATGDSTESSLGDRICEAVLGRVEKSRVFQPVDPAVVMAALRDTPLEPGEPLTSERVRPLAAAVARRGPPVDCFLRGTIATGVGKQSHRTLTLELIDATDGTVDSESVALPADRAAGWW